MILVDADACPVKEIILECAKQYQTEVTYYLDQSHVYSNEEARVVIVGQGHDSVDMEILKVLSENDIVITQDYGLASLCLLKKAHVLNQNGLIYTNSNIDSLLSARFEGVKMRKANKHIRGPKKRTPENDVSFRQSLIQVLEEIQ